MELLRGVNIPRLPGLKELVPREKWFPLEQRIEVAQAEEAETPSPFLAWILKEPKELFDPIRIEMNLLLAECMIYAGITNEEDLRLIDETAAFAHRCHDLCNQDSSKRYRKDGLPYISHPIRCARRIAQKGLAMPLILAALLHDVFEDTECTENDVREFFGEENNILANQVINHIETVTKITGPEQEPHEAETELNLYLAAFTDPAGIIIKFTGDRIDNLQTLEHLPPAKRQQIAVQSYRLANLADSLGMGETGEEMRELALPYLFEPGSPQAEQVERAFANRQQHREQFIDTFNFEAFKQGILDSLPSLNGQPLIVFNRYLPITAFYRHIGHTIEAIPPESVPLPITIITPDEQVFQQIYDLLTTHIREKPEITNNQTTISYQIGDYHLKISLYTYDGWLYDDSSILDLFRRRAKPDPYLPRSGKKPEAILEKRREYAREKLKAVRQVIEPLREEYRKAKAAQDPSRIEEVAGEILKYAHEGVTLPFTTVWINNMATPVPVGSNIYEILYRQPEFRRVAPRIDSVLINGKEQLLDTPVKEGDEITISPDQPSSSWNCSVGILDKVITDQAREGVREALVSLLNLWEQYLLLDMVKRYTKDGQSAIHAELNQLGIPLEEFKHLIYARLQDNPEWMQNVADELNATGLTPQQLETHAQMIADDAQREGKRQLKQLYQQLYRQELDIHIDAPWKELPVEFRQQYGDDPDTFFCQVGLRNVPEEHITFYVESAREYWRRLPKEVLTVPNVPQVLGRLALTVGALANIAQVQIDHDVLEETGWARISITFEAGTEQEELLRRVLDLAAYGLNLTAEYGEPPIPTDADRLPSHAPIGWLYRQLHSLLKGMPAVSRRTREIPPATETYQVRLDLPRNLSSLPYHAVIGSIGSVQELKRTGNQLMITFVMDPRVRRDLEVLVCSPQQPLVTYLQSLLQKMAEMATLSEAPPPSSAPSSPVDR